MDNLTSYARQLRALGEALEERRINVFDLSRQGNHYVIFGRAENDSSVLGRLRQWRERLNGRIPLAPVTFGAGDLERVDAAGRRKRSRPNGLPDYHSLSNILRTVGFYLESRDAELLEIHKSWLNLTILYRTKDGHPRVEERSIGSFYDLFVKLHGARNKTASAEVKLRPKASS